MSARTRGADEVSELIYGVHPVAQAIESRPGAVERILTSREAGARLGRILRLARLAGVPVSYLPAEVLARRVGPRVAHQGIVAEVAPHPYRSTDEVCAAARAGRPGRLVVLDGLTDPQNVGAAVRTAAAAGVHGMILGPATAGLGPGVAKASAGTFERLPIAREERVPPRLVELAGAGFRVVALCPRGAKTWCEADLGGPLVLVLGGEARGVRPGILDACTERVTIPMPAGVESLNVSVALGVVLFEAVRQGLKARWGA